MPTLRDLWKKDPGLVVSGGAHVVALVFLLLVALLVLVAASFLTLPLQWSALFTPEAARTTLEFLRGFMPPDLSAPFLRRVSTGVAETLAMSAVGTLLAALAGLLLATWARMVIS